MTAAGWVDPPAVDVPYGIWSAHHDDLRAQVRQWVATHITPHVDAWEAAGATPRELFAAAGAAGLFGWKVGREAGGNGPDFVADAVVAEELAACGSGGVAAALGAHKDLGPYYLWRFGTDEQRRRYMPDFLSGARIGALGVTEPEAGSDVAALKTAATRDGDGWVLNGAKTFITNGGWADVLVIAALTDPQQGGHHGMSLFLVERDDPGFSSQRIDTLGWRTSSTAQLHFDGVRLGADRLLGGQDMLHRGFVAIMHNFQWERIGMAVGAVRAATEMLQLTHDAMASTTAAELAAEVAAARSLTYRALRMFVAGEDAVRETSMAKWYACELDVRVCEAAVEACGWDGLRGGRVERALRDARLGPIGGGTTQIMKEVIGRGYGP